MRRLSPKAEEVLESISRDRKELLRSVEGLSATQTEYRSEPEAWSVADILHHLALAEEASGKLMSLMLKRAREENLPPDPDPDRSVMGSIDAAVAGADDQKAMAPDRVTPRSHVPAGEALGRLEASRERLVACVMELSSYDVSRLSYPHPFFGELDTYQWLLVTGWHERRHRAQIDRIKKSPGFPNE